MRDEGAVPATVAVDAGRLLVGAPGPVLERLADPSSGAAKAASRDLAPLLASGRLASTTVSATMRIAAMAGIRLFATGGIGGVHRGAATTFDVSSDIDELAATAVAVVSSGAKSILDLPATLELLETRRVPVIGIGTDTLPAFYSTSSGLPVPHRVDAAGRCRGGDPAAPRPPRVGRDPVRAAASSGPRHRRGGGRRLDSGRHIRGECPGDPGRSGDAIPPRARGRALGRAHAAHQHRPDRRERADGCRIAVALANAPAAATV